MIIPFFIPHAGCPHQCVFCNQRNITGRSASAGASSLPEQVKAYLMRRAAPGPVEIAFYGGSFTALPLRTQTDYLEAAEPFIHRGQVEGIRLSTRPDCIDGEVLSFLKSRHVRTVELGVQSMDDRVLTLAGRGHSAADTAGAAGLVKEFGFTLGLQVMAGLPGDSPAGFAETVDAVIALKPDFIRIYPVLVIRDTPLEKLYNSGRYTPLALDLAVLLCRDALMKCHDAGVPVIRIGLQPTEELDQPGTILAGPYHPAFGQLVESSLFLDMMRTALRMRQEASDAAVFLVNAGGLSSAIGQKRSNIAALKKEFRLRDIRVREGLQSPERGRPFLRLVTPDQQ